MATDAALTGNFVNTEEIKKIVSTSVRTLINNPGMADKLPAIMLRGSPGIGKSTIIRTIADEMGLGFVDIRLAQMERVDFCGLPSVKDETTQWNVPSIWPRDAQSKGIILLDEITSAPPDVQVAAYQVTLDRAISNSNYKLPPGWYVIAAGNLNTDRAVVKTMSSALANRFMHFNVAPDASAWGRWAITKDIHPSVTGFIQFRPGLLFKMDGQNLEQGWPSPRAWERVSNMIAVFAGDEGALQKAVYGLVGPGAGSEFMAFHRSNLHVQDVVRILTDPNAEVNVPSKIDEKCAFCAAVSYQLWAGRDDADDAVRVEGLYRILDKLTPDFTALLVKNAMLGNGRVKGIEAIKKIMASKQYPVFAAKHAACFTTDHSLTNV